MDLIGAGCRCCRGSIEAGQNGSVENGGRYCSGVSAPALRMLAICFLSLSCISGAAAASNAHSASPPLPSAMLLPDAAPWSTAFIVAVSCLCGLLLCVALLWAAPAPGLALALAYLATGVTASFLYLLSYSFYHPAIFWISVISFVAVQCKFLVGRVLPALRACAGTCARVWGTTFSSPPAPWTATDWDSWSVNETSSGVLFAFIALCFLKLLWLAFVVAFCAYYVAWLAGKIIFATVVSLALALWFLLAAAFGLLCSGLQLTCMKCVDGVVLRLMAAAPFLDAGGDVDDRVSPSPVDDGLSASAPAAILAHLACLALPQVLLQALNNSLLQCWQPLGVFSLSMTCFCILNFGPRFVWHIWFVADSGGLVTMPLGGGDFEVVTPFASFKTCTLSAGMLQRLRSSGFFKGCTACVPTAQRGAAALCSACHAISTCICCGLQKRRIQPVTSPSPSFTASPSLPGVSLPTPSAPPLLLPPLPASVWQALVDSQSGKTYYYNTVNGATQWNKPSGWVAAALPPPPPLLPLS